MGGTNTGGQFFTTCTFYVNRVIEFDIIKVQNEVLEGANRLNAQFCSKQLLYIIHFTSTIIKGTFCLFVCLFVFCFF